MIYITRFSILVECTILSLKILTNYPFGVYLPFFLPGYVCSIYRGEKYFVQISYKYLLMVLLYASASNLSTHF